MKIRNQTEFIADLATRQKPRRPGILGIALIAIATATIPATAGNSLASKESSDAIRPFQVSIPKSELTELRRRIKATQWPTRELVTDASQGVQLATIRKLARYWSTDYDWRRCEAQLNALPQFSTGIDGADRMSSTKLREVGQSEHSPNSSTITSSTKVDTSRPGTKKLFSEELRASFKSLRNANVTA